MVSTPWFETPPTGYGGIEAMCADLVDGLVSLGHEVTLIGVGDHHTAAKRFASTYSEPQGGRVGQSIPEVLHAARAARVLSELDRSDALDLIHDHSTTGPLAAQCRPAPTVVTAHGPANGEFGQYYRALGDTIALVAISDAQRASAPDLPWIGRVYNAIPVHTYPFNRDKGDYALFLGRCSPEKGAHLAIDAAHEAGVRLLMAGKCSEPPERAYFEAEIEPRLGDHAVWLGEADAERKRELLAWARCLLMPVCWEEPFGIVMAEALACGTPVAGFPRGSVPEVVHDGVTGILCDGVDELAKAIIKCGRLDPAACRADAQERFDVPAMARGYEAVYLDLC